MSDNVTSTSCILRVRKTAASSTAPILNKLSVIDTAWSIDAVRVVFEEIMLVMLVSDSLALNVDLVPVDKCIY